jgi:hypothetical protein
VTASRSIMRATWNAVRTHLESHKLIRSFKSADVNNGGDGATEAYLVDYNLDLLKWD